MAKIDQNNSTQTDENIKKDDDFNADPFSQEIERALLGSLMAAPDETVGPTSGMIPPDAFYYKENRILYEAIANVYEGGALDLVLLRDYLKKKKLYEDVGGSENVIDIATDTVPSAANWKYYADKLLAYRDQRIVAGMVRAVNNTAGTPQEQLAKIQALVGNTDISNAGQNGEAFVLTCMSDVAPKPLEWFWHDKIPDNGLSMIQGDPGVSKTFLSIRIGCQISNGTPWPDCPDIPVKQGNVIILCGEDDNARIEERIAWMGGDKSRIYILARKKGIDIRYHLPIIQKFIDNLDGGCRLIIIDPITGFMGNCKQNSNNEVRPALDLLNEFAAANKLTILAINHMNKREGDKHVYRGLGSMGFTAVCRSVWGIIFDPNDEDHDTRLMCPVKTNYSISPSGLKYQIIDNAIEFEKEPFYGSIDEVSGKAKDSKESLAQECADWLKERLKGKESSSETIQQEAEDKGFKFGVLKRAKKIAGVKSRKENALGGQWFMYLPEVVE